MLSCFCFLFKNNTPPSWMALVSLFLLFSSYLLVLRFGFLSMLYTFLVLLLSTTVVVLYSSVSKHKPVYVDNLVQEEKEAEEEVHNNSIISPDLLSSESECQEQDQLWTSEDSEVGWSFQYDDVDDNSDGSISDEESLIEIALPSGQCSLQQKKKRELSSAEALFSQQSIIREFLSEFNEEENLIEIDISMGSIKYSSVSLLLIPPKHWIPLKVLVSRGKNFSKASLKGVSESLKWNLPSSLGFFGPRYEWL